MLLAIVGTLFHHGIVDYKWIAIGAGAGLDHRRAAGHGADDGRAAADRALATPSAPCASPWSARPSITCKRPTCRRS